MSGVVEVGDWLEAIRVHPVENLALLFGKVVGNELR